MLSKLTSIQLLLTFLLQQTAAQILTSGNTKLPSCASSCTLLNQAAQACGGTTSANQGSWICFCQSGYLKSLYTSPNGICDAFCTDPSQNALVQTWYKTECGTDNGASEHANGAGAGAGTTATTGTATTTTATNTASSASGSAASGTFVPEGLNPVDKGGWWANHYQWVVMLLVIIIGMVLLTFLFIWLKRRHARKRDAVVGSFNEGITMRSTPMTSVANPAPVYNSSGSGRDSPVRTRDAFMPYGYGYSRSESRLGSRTNVGDSQVKSSPLAHDGTTLAELEGEGGGSAGKKKRVYVRERSISGRESPEWERR